MTVHEHDIRLSIDRRRIDNSKHDYDELLDTVSLLKQTARDNLESQEIRYAKSSMYSFSFLEAKAWAGLKLDLLFTETTTCGC